MQTTKFDKYKENLSLVDIDGEQFIQSYNTLVAKVVGKDTLVQLGYWSMTTQKHINYAAKELNLILIK